MEQKAADLILFCKQKSLISASFSILCKISCPGDGGVME